MVINESTCYFVDKLTYFMLESMLGTYEMQYGKRPNMISLSESSLKEIITQDSSCLVGCERHINSLCGCGVKIDNSLRHNSIQLSREVQPKRREIMEIELLECTSIDTIAKATAMPYQSKESAKLVKNVWDSDHRSIARHSVASFLITNVSQDLLRQLSRHPHINLTVKSSRYCDMSDATVYVPKDVRDDVKLSSEYQDDMERILTIYRKWKTIEREIKFKHKNERNRKRGKDLAKMFLPLASTTDVVVSGNFQAWFEFLQLRNCTRAQEEINKMSLRITKILKEHMGEIFGSLGCKGDQLGYCPEKHDYCGKYPQKENKKIHSIEIEGQLGIEL